MQWSQRADDYNTTLKTVQYYTNFHSTFQKCQCETEMERDRCTSKETSSFYKDKNNYE